MIKRSLQRKAWKIARLKSWSESVSSKPQKPALCKLPPRAPQAYTTSSSNGTSTEISTKSRKLIKIIEALLDDESSLEAGTKQKSVCWL